MFQNKKVMITGGLGFNGSNLVIKLVDLGADVTLLDTMIPEYGGKEEEGGWARKVLGGM